MTRESDAQAGADGTEVPITDKVARDSAGFRDVVAALERNFAFHADVAKRIATSEDLRNQLAHSSAVADLIGESPAGTTLAQEIDLKRTLLELQSELDDKRKKLRDAELKSGALAAAWKSAEETAREIRQKERLAFVTSRIRDDAKPFLFSSAFLQKRFCEGGDCSAFILAADIRRSTDLMLKARSPEQYADFISELCAVLRHVITEHMGVFDKFTGDGVLAFFPDFFSGEDAGYSAIRAAETCHDVFRQLYDARRSCFHAVPKDAGLGIGVDFGIVRLLRISDSLTVVGTPVVYACRMSGAPSGSTFVNQPAFENLLKGYSAYLSFEETEYDAKHEGRILAYRVRRNAKPYEARRPGWHAAAIKDLDASTSKQD